MIPGEPLESPEESPPSPPPLAAWRNVASLGLLSIYVLLPFLVFLASEGPRGPALPRSVVPVLSVAAWELVIFTVVLGSACRLARLEREDLMWRWVGGWRAVPRAFVWAMILRLGVAIILGAILGLMQWAAGAAAAEQVGAGPDVGAVVDFQALRDPWYLLVMSTLVSFVVAGLREELWRAASITLLGRVFPARFGGTRGAWLAVVPVAVLFGMGHASQGVYGIYATLLLGVGLGALLLWRRSLADAVLAHGFLDATTFLLAAALLDRFPEWLA